MNNTEILLLVLALAVAVSSGALAYMIHLLRQDLGQQIKTQRSIQEAIDAQSLAAREVAATLKAIQAPLDSTHTAFRQIERAIRVQQEAMGRHMYNQEHNQLVTRRSQLEDDASLVDAMTDAITMELEHERVERQPFVTSEEPVYPVHDLLQGMEQRIASYLTQIPGTSRAPFQSVFLSVKALPNSMHAVHLVDFLKKATETTRAAHEKATATLKAESATVAAALEALKKKYGSLSEAA